MLARNGYRVANCGSMNAKAIQGQDNVFVPDPWCTTEPPNPAELSAYYDVVTRLVHDSSSGQVKALPKSAYVRFLNFMLGHGLSMTTITSILKQLWSDTVMRKPTSWKRVVILDKLQFDIFRHYWRTKKPQFSTFFLNSTAHYQHAYWHLLFPDKFAPPIESNAPPGAEGAILYGYQQMDDLLARFARLESEGATLVLSTALSQQANPNAGKVFYRPHDAAAFLRILDADCQELLPVMAHQYSARFANEQEAEKVRIKLTSLKCDGKPVIDIADSPESTIFFGVRSGPPVPKSARVQGSQGVEFAFHDHFYILPTIKSGAHHPDSVLWIKNGQPKRHAKPVSILDILPTILDSYQMDLKAIDGGNARVGRSLWPLMNGTVQVEQREKVLEAGSR
jgi:hypothetical protein